MARIDVTEGYFPGIPVDVLTSSGTPGLRRVQVDVGQTGFFAGREFRSFRELTINATPFVPKAHTPFQWEGMTPAATIRARQKSIHNALARHGVEVRADSPDWAEVQAVLSRGDRSLAQVLLAIPPGRLSLRTFFDTMEACGLDKEHYAGAWQTGAPLPSPSPRQGAPRGVHVAQASGSKPAAKGVLDLLKEGGKKLADNPLLASLMEPVQAPEMAPVQQPQSNVPALLDYVMQFQASRRIA